MATPISDHEKQEVSYAEHVETTADSSSNDLHKMQTLSGVDMHNTCAVKGDDSDGKVIWSLRSIFSAIFLAALYTGTLDVHGVSRQKLTVKAHKSSFTSRAVRSRSSEKISASPAELSGCQPLPSWP